MGGDLIVVEALRKVYRSRRRGDVTAVDDVSFAVPRGEIVGILGPNGAGKTTTIKCMCTLLRPTAGRVEIAGVDVVGKPRRAAEMVAGVLEGNRNVYWRLTPAENLQFFAALQGIPRHRVRSHVDDLLERFGLTEKRRTPARMLSKGTQQKLALACAFVRATPVLLLDEPTLGLDVESSHELRAQIVEMSERGERTVLLSSHDMAVVESVCERVIVVQGGRVVVDDRVANLIELFKARAYRFTVAGTIDHGVAGRLHDTFGLIEITNGAGDATIEVELADGGGLYQLLDLLRDTGRVIESIDRRDPNLEEIFLRIVKGQAPR